MLALRAMCACTNKHCTRPLSDATGSLIWPFRRKVLAEPTSNAHSPAHTVTACLLIAAALTALSQGLWDVNLAY